MAGEVEYIKDGVRVKVVVPDGNVHYYRINSTNRSHRFRGVSNGIDYFLYAPDGVNDGDLAKEWVELRVNTPRSQDAISGLILVRATKSSKKSVI